MSDGKKAAAEGYWDDKSEASDKLVLAKVEVGGKMIDSTSDQRVTNNVMRHEYRKLTEVEKAAMKTVKDKGLVFVEFLDALGQSRELSLAKTKMEEAVMWATKHITK